MLTNSRSNLNRAALAQTLTALARVAGPAITRQVRGALSGRGDLVESGKKLARQLKQLKKAST